MIHHIEGMYFCRIEPIIMAGASIGTRLTGLFIRAMGHGILFRVASTHMIGNEQMVLAITQGGCAHPPTLFGFAGKDCRYLIGPLNLNPAVGLDDRVEFIRLFRALYANEFAPTIHRIILFIL
jgi:hypothetical protein